jgi:hypothetical protein
MDSTKNLKPNRDLIKFYFVVTNKLTNESALLEAYSNVGAKVQACAACGWSYDNCYSRMIEDWETKYYTGTYDAT